MKHQFDNQSILISSLKKGDENAFVYLVKTFDKLIFNYALSLTNDRASAQDIVQDVFMSVWKDRKKLNEDYSLKSFIYKIAHNKFINQYHKNRSISALERAYTEALNEITVESYNKEILEKKLRILSESINDLPKKCKQIFLLSKKEGLTNMEVADHLNISTKTVEGHLTKAFKILKTSVESKLTKIILFLFKGNKYNLKKNFIEFL